METVINPLICPLCGKPNNCGQAAKKGEKCWCAYQIFPPELLKKVPKEAINKACICAPCLQAYKKKSSK